VKEGDDQNGQNDRTYLDQENQLISMPLSWRIRFGLDPQITIPTSGFWKMPQIQALQKATLDHSHTWIKSSCTAGGNHRSASPK